MRNGLLANIQTFKDIQSWEIGERVLTRVFSVEKLKPQRVATFGEVTVKHGFDVESIEDCRLHWASKASMRGEGVLTELLEDFNWKRTKVAKSQGMVTFPKKDMRGTQLSGGLFFEAQFRKDIDWGGIFAAWCGILTPYGAILHPTINLDRPIPSGRDVREFSLDEEITDKAWSQFSSGIFHSEFRAGELNSLVSGLTNLGWASFFGGKLASEVDVDAISTAGFPIQKIGEGYLIQVTDDINDLLNDFAMFSERRAELKSLFREGLFLIKDEPIVS